MKTTLSLWSIFKAPFWLFVVSLAGIMLALFVDSTWDWLATLLVSSAVAIPVFFYLRAKFS
uniref:hypothetical protein n=1 Tax=Ningiella ruwaisensis TaxID=2364274 RepID=UPI00109F63BA|nr:hypothetical protein [Ningiella ruwaisensis]